MGTAPRCVCYAKISTYRVAQKHRKSKEISSLYGLD
nr:MAG TPA: hypothetical protein [Caudoviricetes sp.]